MTTLGWITVGGLAMSVLALSGSLTLLLPERLFHRVVPPLVALAAGTLIGGALLHMLPEAVEAMGNGLPVYVWLIGGFLGFFVLEQLLHWHHCHRAVDEHDPWACSSSSPTGCTTSSAAWPSPGRSSWTCGWGR